MRNPNICRCHSNYNYDSNCKRDCDGNVTAPATELVPATMTMSTNTCTRKVVRSASPQPGPYTWTLYPDPMPLFVTILDSPIGLRRSHVSPRAHAGHLGLLGWRIYVGGCAKPNSKPISSPDSNPSSSPSPSHTPLTRNLTQAYPNRAPNPSYHQSYNSNPNLHGEKELPSLSTSAIPNGNLSCT